jgi:hypothetical protein
VPAFLRPTQQGEQSYALNLFPVENHQSSKTGTQDETVPLGQPYVRFLEPEWERLAQQAPQRKVLEIDYDTLLEQFHMVSLLLGIKIRPSQGRHSGASVDRALGVKTDVEVLKHG